MRAALLCMLCLPFASASASAPDAGAPVLTKPPTLSKQVEAVFPPDALDAGLTGTVTMEVDIGTDGKVLDARVVQSAGNGFDEAALEAVRQFEFTPAEVNGVPAPVRILYAYEFLYRSQRVEAPSIPEAVNFSGVLLERGTRKPLAGASIVLRRDEDIREAVSGSDGRFEMKGVPPGAWDVVVSAEAHARYQMTEEIREGVRTDVTYFVRRRDYSAYETVVRDTRERKEVSEISLRQEEIRLIPGTQGDALRVVQNLPGVARAPFGAGLLIVRGGKAWDTRVYLEDTLVPLLFHFGGLTATFNSNLLEDISFQPGNFSTEFGRNIGGLVKADARTPAKDRLQGYLDVNVVDTSFLLEGPIGKDWSFAASGRRSYIDTVLPWVLNTFVPNSDALNFTVAPRFYDFQVKLERRPEGSRDRFSITFFGSNDQLALVLANPALDPEGRGEFSTLLAYNRLAVNWVKHLSETAVWRSAFSLGWDQYDFGIGGDLYFKATQWPAMTRQGLELEFPKQRLSLSMGLDVIALPFRYSAQSPPRFKLNQIPDPFISRQLIQEESLSATVEPAVYVEAVWRPWERLKLIPGIRVDYESYMDDVWVDPRISAFYELTPTTTVKASAGLFHQTPDYRQGTLSAKFGNPRLLPEAATHYSVGVEQIITETTSLDVQVYYKSLFHQAQSTLAPAAGSEGSIDDLNLQYRSDGRGESAGVELLLRHQLTRNFFGWIAYSFSRARRYQPLIEAMGAHPYDQPHNLIAIASYKLPYDFVVGARVRYASGALNTPYVGAIYDANGNYYFPLMGEQYSRRLPDFFQLDIRIDKKFVFNNWILSLYADVLNVTNHGNVESVLYNFDYTQQQYLYGLPILPALGVRGEF